MFLKSVAAICLAMLIDRTPNVDYDDLVTKYWPEFGKYGKESITIDMLLAHQVLSIMFDMRICISVGISLFRYESRME